MGMHNSGLIELGESFAEHLPMKFDMDIDGRSLLLDSSVKQKMFEIYGNSNNY